MISLHDIQLSKAEAERFIIKCRMLGKTVEFECDGAIYIIRWSRVFLKKVLVPKGIFEIPYFVTDLERNEDDFSVEAFMDCTSIKVINNSQITDMSHMFTHCVNLNELDLSEFDTSKVTDLSSFLENCWNLTSLTLKLDTRNVISMERMFYGCEKLEYINILDFDTRNLEDMDECFAGCSRLKRIVFGAKFISPKVKTMARAFAFCTALEEIDLSCFTITPKINKVHWVNECPNLKRIKIKEIPICSDWYSSGGNSGHSNDDFM